MDCRKYIITYGQIYSTIIELLKHKDSITTVDVAKKLDVPVECLALMEVSVETILLGKGIKTTRVKYCPKCKKVYQTTERYCPVHKEQKLIPIMKYEK